MTLLPLGLRARIPVPRGLRARLPVPRGLRARLPVVGVAVRSQERCSCWTRHLFCGCESLLQVGYTSKELSNVRAVVARLRSGICALARGHRPRAAGSQLGDRSLHVLHLAEKVVDVSAVASFAGRVPETLCEFVLDCREAVVQTP